MKLSLIAAAWLASRSIIAHPQTPFSPCITCQAPLGVCRDSDPKGDCGFICVDRRTDVKNCGFCGETCPPGVECVNGQCIFTTFDECTGGTIDTGFERCGNTNNGFCFKSIDFGSFCGSDIKCVDASKCFKSVENLLFCSQGFFCAENTSCGDVCVPSVKWYGQENRTVQQLRELARSDTVTGPAGQKKWKGPNPK